MFTQQEKQALLGITKKVGKASLQALGRSRRRRAVAGKWYFGRKVGIPPNRPPRMPPRNGSGGLAVTATTTRATNLGQTLKQLQSANVRIEKGTESFGDVLVLSDWLVNGYATVLSQIINPADPGTFPALSAISNQYQRFRTQSLVFTYTPSASTAVNGTLYMAFVPDADADDPQDISAIQSLLGCVSVPVYGTSSKLVVTPQMLQQAYNVQQIYKPEMPGEVETTLNAAGKFIVGVSGVTPPEGGLTLGTITCTYGFAFSTRQLKVGSNQVSSQYYFNGASDELELVRQIGHTLFYEDSHGNLVLRSSRAGHFMFSVHVNGATAFVLETSKDAVTWDLVTPSAATTGTTSCANTYVCPWSRYIRFSIPGLSAHVGVYAMGVSLSY